MKSFAVFCLSAVLALPVLAHDDSPAPLAPGQAAAVAVGPVTTGQNGLLFTTVPGWAQLPEGVKQFGPLHGSIAQDKAGLYYISSDAKSIGILVFDKTGKCLKTLGGKELAGIHGMTLREENGVEVIYAAQLSHHRLIKFDLTGKVLLTIGAPDGAWKPTAIAVSSDGSIFAADGYGSSRIFKLDATGKLLKTFSGRGKDEGKTQTCHGLAIDNRDGVEKLLVCDRENRRLSHFDLEGKFLKVLTENLRRPCAVSIRGDQVAVAELESRVVILDKDNKVVSILGDNPNKQQWATNNVKPADIPEGIFGSPHGVLFDRDGNVVVQDWNLTGRISFLKPEAK
jgi:DNA-binding beta-propeller fold protein YncE